MKDVLESIGKELLELSVGSGTWVLSMGLIQMRM